MKEKLEDISGIMGVSVRAITSFLADGTSILFESQDAACIIHCTKARIKLSKHQPIFRSVS